MNTEIRRLPHPFEDYLVSSDGEVFSDKCQITMEQMDEIRAMTDRGVFQRDIAAAFGISQASISLYLLGKSKYPPGSKVKLRTALTGAGYPGVSLCATRHGIPKRTQHIHELVALAFIGPRPSGMEVRHIDGNKLNNSASNLSYGTSKENAADRDLHGRTAHVGNRGHKLSNQLVWEIRERVASGETQLAVALDCGVSHFYVSRLINRLARSEI